MTTNQEEQYVLITYSPDWADECEMPGFTLCTQGWWKDYQDSMLNARMGVGWGFGSNEYNDYDDAESFLSELKVKTISQEASQTIQKSFSLRSWRDGSGYVGHFGHELPDAPYFDKDEQQWYRP